MSGIGAPVTAEQLAAIEADACAAQNETKRRSFLDRWGKVGLATLAASVLTACNSADAQTSQENDLSPAGVTRMAENGDQMKPITVSITTEGQPVEKTETAVYDDTVIKAMEDSRFDDVDRASLRKYVDYDGQFDYGSARTEMGMVDARLLRAEWKNALADAVVKA